MSTKIDYSEKSNTGDIFNLKLNSGMSHNIKHTPKSLHDIRDQQILPNTHKSKMPGIDLMQDIANLRLKQAINNNNKFNTPKTPDDTNTNTQQNIHTMDVTAPPKKRQPFPFVETPRLPTTPSPKLHQIKTATTTNNTSDDGFICQFTGMFKQHYVPIIIVLSIIAVLIVLGVLLIKKNLHKDVK